MRVLMVNGSPHINGLCYKLLLKVAEGVRETGNDIEFIQLAKFNIGPCKACTLAPCWGAMKCNFEDDALKIRKMFNECDALAFATPVYFLSVNGLAKNFIDRMRNYHKDTRPSLVLTVAGGTGKGCIMTLQEVCRWMVLIGFAPVIAEPITRYNFDETYRLARGWGHMLVESIGKVPQLTTLYEKLLYFEKIPYMKYTIIDEILYLAKSAIEAISRKGKVEDTIDLRLKVKEAETQLKLGYWEEGLRIAVEVQEESMHRFNKLS